MNGHRLNFLTVRHFKCNKDYSIYLDIGQLLKVVLFLNL